MNKVFVVLLASFFSLNAKSEILTEIETQSLNFNAPVINTSGGNPSESENPVGSIFYDTSNNVFKGLFISGWGNITQGSLRTPIVHTFTSGTGTFTPTAGVLYIRVRMVGGGGGGSGGGTAAGTAATDGGETNFYVQGQSSSSLLRAFGGAPGQFITSAAPAGGNAVLGTGPSGTTIRGGNGVPGFGGFIPSASQAGFPGGASAFGGSGGGSGAANSGAGGGGGAGGANGAGGGGGAAGGFLDAIISNVASAYSYSVGAAGAAGGAGTGGNPGHSGASGFIEVTEYFQ